MEFHASKGMRVKALEERPTASADYLWLWIAFNRLATTRQLTGHGSGPISWLAMKEYANEMRFSADERDFLWDVIRRLDSKFLSITQAKFKQVTKRK